VLNVKDWQTLSAKQLKSVSSVIGSLLHSYKFHFSAREIVILNIYNN
jgi:hypothetical protein